REQPDMHEPDERAHSGNNESGDRSDRRAEEQDARLAGADEGAQRAWNFDRGQAPAGSGLGRTEHQEKPGQRPLMKRYRARRKGKSALAADFLAASRVFP